MFFFRAGHSCNGQRTGLQRLNCGFTLIELMTTVVLLAIMVNMVMPLGQLAEGFKLDYVNQRIYSSAVLAKSEAIKRSSTVSICRSTSGTACDVGLDWSDGWVVFVNPNGNNSIDAGEDVIRVFSPIRSPVTFSWDNGQLLTFISRGSPVSQGTFTLCPVTSRAVPERQVTVSGSGLIRKREGANCI